MRLANGTARPVRKVWKTRRKKATGGRGGGSEEGEGGGRERSAGRKVADGKLLAGLAATVGCGNDRPPALEANIDECPALLALRTERAFDPISVTHIAYILYINVIYIYI